MGVEGEEKGRESLEQSAEGACHVLFVARSVLVKPAFVVVLRKLLKEGERLSRESWKRANQWRLLSQQLKLLDDYRPRDRAAPSLTHGSAIGAFPHAGVR